MIFQWGHNMIEYRVLETKETDKHAKITSKFWPQYKRTFYGIGWWTIFEEFNPSDAREPAATRQAAEDYIAAKQKLKNEYYYD